MQDPIHEHPGYRILGVKMGKTEKSFYYLYWVPEQYVVRPRTPHHRHTPSPLVPFCLGEGIISAIFWATLAQKKNGRGILTTYWLGW